ncbi:MAG: hypothetical protein CEE38_13920 [Planctomycetes bacterium B3_Pla]|nr:MAG: hypothetical protein CEE38_13920 [Planctomycetes bacterium B3_Pla]
MRWEVQSSVRYSERDLLNSAFPDWEIVAHREAASDIAVKLADTLEKYPLMKLSDALEKYEFGRKDIAGSELDFGLVAVFFSQGKKVLRIGVSKYPPAISVNGALFFAEPPVVYKLAALLPLEAYQGMFFYSIVEWALPPYGETAGGLRLMPSRKDPNDLYDSLLEWINQRVEEESANKGK